MPASSVPVPDSATTINPSASVGSTPALAAPVHAEDAPAALAVRQPADLQSIDEWLASIELGGYTTVIKQMGYVSLTFLLEAEHEDIEEIAREYTRNQFRCLKTCQTLTQYVLVSARCFENAEAASKAVDQCMDNIGANG